MSKPSSLPRWADVGGEIVEPSSGEKDIGWTTGQLPPHSYFNWYQNLVYQWTQWLNAFESTVHTWSAVQTFSAGVTATQSTSNTAAITATGNGTAPGLTGIAGSTSGAAGVTGDGSATAAGIGVLGNGHAGVKGTATDVTRGGLEGTGKSAVAGSAGSGLVSVGGAGTIAGTGGAGGTLTGGATSSGTGGTGLVVAGGSGSSAGKAIAATGLVDVTGAVAASTTVTATTALKSPNATKAWGLFRTGGPGGLSGTVTYAAFNIDIASSGYGASIYDFAVIFGTPFSDANYTVQLTARKSDGTDILLPFVTAKAGASFTFNNKDSSMALVDLTLGGDYEFCISVEKMGL